MAKKIAWKANLGKTEPVVKDLQLYHDTQYGELLSWYRFEKTTDDAIQYLVDYLVAYPNVFSAGADRIKKVPKPWINLTAAWIARLIMRGANLPESSHMFLRLQIDEMLKRQPVETTVASIKPKPSVQDHIKNRASELIAELEGKIDDGDHNFGLYLSGEGISALVAQRCIEHFTPIRNELATVAVGDASPELAEGYEKYSKKERITLAGVYHNLIQALEKHTQVAKKPRAPRKRKPITAEKALKHFVFLQKHDKFGLASIHPERILGTQELWTFNTKNNVLAVYRALDRGGLSVKRTYIAKYDDKTSMAKRIGRKTDERLQIVLSGGKIALKKLMDDISGDIMPVPRINKDTVLLRTN